MLWKRQLVPSVQFLDKSNTILPLGIKGQKDKFSEGETAKTTTTKAIHQILSKQRLIRPKS